MYDEKKIYVIGANKITKVCEKILNQHCNNTKLLIFNYPDEFSMHLRRHLANAYSVGVVICDLSVSTNRFKSLFEDFKESFVDGFLKFIFIDNQLSASEISTLMNDGVCSIISKDYTEEELLNAIKFGFDGSSSKMKTVVKNITAVARFGNLTSKEISILSLMLNGYTNKEIAKKLSNSSRTIEIHRASIFEKMNVKNAIELASILNS